MKFVKLIELTLLLMFSFLMITITSANAEDTSRKIIMFHDGITMGEILEYTGEIENEGAEVVMKLSMINGIVAEIPVNMSIDDLSGDYRVMKIEDDKAIRVKRSVKHSSKGKI